MYTHKQTKINHCVIISLKFVKAIGISLTNSWLLTYFLHFCVCPAGTCTSAPYFSSVAATLSCPGIILLLALHNTIYLQDNVLQQEFFLTIPVMHLICAFAGYERKCDHVTTDWQIFRLTVLPKDGRYRFYFLTRFFWYPYVLCFENVFWYHQVRERLLSSFERCLCLCIKKRLEKSENIDEISIRERLDIRYFTYNHHID